MTKSRHLIRPRRRWSEREIVVLRRDYPNKQSWMIARALHRPLHTVYQMAQKLDLHKSAEFNANEKLSGRYNKFVCGGMASRFKKGQIPLNKGTRRPGWFAGRMRETQFKKGNRPHTWRPIGSERINADGYHDLKISDTGYTPRDWRPLHLLLWEKTHGPVPCGHRITFKDRDKSNIVLENLKCVTFRELMRRNTIARFPRAVRSAIHLTAKLRRTIERIDHVEQDRRPA